MTRKPKDQRSSTVAAFEEMERETVTRGDVESAVRQVMKHPAKPKRQSENREPTRAELSQRWKMTRRG